MEETENKIKTRNRSSLSDEAARFLILRNVCGSLKRNYHFSGVLCYDGRNIRETKKNHADRINDTKSKEWN